MEAQTTTKSPTSPSISPTWPIQESLAIHGSCLLKQLGVRGTAVAADTHQDVTKLPTSSVNTPKEKNKNVSENCTIKINILI
jgi:hypothetical protein